mmetsp:Transcript_24838/g.80008  ORF Transcript_24838/g.80008 Transcript_24838/m.80008 type:complete len:235 (+) Transcript_24838:507-1211(+)
MSAAAAAAAGLMALASAAGSWPTASAPWQGATQATRTRGAGKARWPSLSARPPTAADVENGEDTHHFRGAVSGRKHREADAPPSSAAWMSAAPTRPHQHCCATGAGTLPTQTSCAMGRGRRAWHWIERWGRSGPWRPPQRQEAEPAHRSQGREGIHVRRRAETKTEQWRGKWLRAKGLPLTLRSSLPPARAETRRSPERAAARLACSHGHAAPTSRQASPPLRCDSSEGPAASS